VEKGMRKKEKLIEYGESRESEGHETPLVIGQEVLDDGKKKRVLWFFNQTLNFA
jgi:hypothetical protein